MGLEKRLPVKMFHSMYRTRSSCKRVGKDYTYSRSGKNDVNTNTEPDENAVKVKELTKERLA